MTAAAIVGLGLTDVGRVYGRGAPDFAREAVSLAVNDAGLDMTEIDGLLVSSGKSGRISPTIAEDMGLENLSLLMGVDAFGASAGAMVQVAATAISAGTANAVVCVFADAPLREGARGSDVYRRTEAKGFSGHLRASGIRTTTSYYALAAQRHMDNYGTTSEQLGAIAVAQRSWAVHNPAA